MRLIRGWESQYLPEIIGGLRLSKAKTFRKIGEEEGIGDSREGEIRVELPVTLSSVGDNPMAMPIDFTMALGEDEPPVVIENVQPGETREAMQSLRVDDAALDSPFLFCLAREPTTVEGWEKLKASLPQRYDAWTVTDDINALQFEIEIGIKRWLALKGITMFNTLRTMGWVVYPYDEFPPAIPMDEPAEEGQTPRWFQKRRRYRDQQEYRLAWDLTSPQWEEFPSTVDIELTRTGLGLFVPWSPPGAVA